MSRNGPPRDEDDEDSPHDREPYHPGKDGFPGLPSANAESRFGLDDEIHVRMDEREDSYQIIIDSPGIRKDTVKLSSERNYITILAELEKETSFGEPYILHENVRIADDADEDSATYQHNNGVLMVSIPRE